MDKNTLKLLKMLILFLSFLLSGCVFANSNRSEESKYGYYSYSEFLEMKDNDKKLDRLWNKSFVDLTLSPLIYYNKDILAFGENIVRISSNGALKWSVSNPKSDFLEITPFVQDGVLWVLSEKIYGFNVETGEKIVEEKIENREIESHDSAYYNGNLYTLASAKGETKYYELLEWNIKEKKLMRTFRVPETDYYSNWSSVLVCDGIAYFSSPYLKKEDRAGLVVAIDINEWKELWRYELPKGKLNGEYMTIYVCVAFSSIIEDDSKIIFPTSRGLIALNKKTGEKIWTTISPFEKSYLEGAGNGLSKKIIFDKEKKRLYWQTSSSDYNHNGKIDPDNEEENIFCIDVETGKKIWARGTGLSEDLRAPELYNGYLYIPLNNGMCVVNADTGAKVAGLAFDRVGQTGIVVGFIDGVGYLFEAMTTIGFVPYK